MDREHIYDQRAHVTRGIVLAVDDTGAAQLVTVQTHDGATRVAEVHHAFGDAAVPPANGSVVVLIANGGDPSDMIAVPAACPLGRMGGLRPGEKMIYGADGSRVYIQQGGTITVLAAAEIVLQAPGVNIKASAGATVTGNLSVTGTLSVSGNCSIGGSLTVAGTINGH